MLRTSFIIMAIITLGMAVSNGEENPAYSTIDRGKVSCHLGIISEDIPEGDGITVSAIAVGKGSDWRSWEVSDVKLVIDGERIRPSTSEDFYATKESVFRFPGAVVFAAIGSQHVQQAYGLSTGPGGGTIVVERERSPIAEGIDRTGMAAGMGLLVSSAKGEIKGKKCGFVLDDGLAGRIDGNNDRVDLVLENAEAQKKERIRMELTEKDLTGEE